MANDYGAASLNGSSQYGTVSDDDDIDFGVADFAIDVSFTVGGGAGTTRVLLHKGESGVLGWVVHLNSSNVLQLLLNDKTYPCSADVTDGEWHHFHVSVDKSAATAYILVDGTLDGTLDITDLSTLSNDEDFEIGWNGTDSYWNGKVSEIRLSERVRHTEAFSQDILPFADDAWTKSLFHFHEGQYSGGTAYDMSEYRNHMAVTDSPETAAGPFEASPAVIIYEQIWLALDAYSNLTTFLDARNGKKFRFRGGDLIPGEWTVVHCPALLIVPAALPDFEEETSAFHQIKIPMEIKGYLHHRTIFDIMQYWWVVLKAVWNSYNDQTTVGRFNWARIQHMKSKGPSFDVQETEDESFFSSFSDTFEFEVRHDLLG